MPEGFNPVSRRIFAPALELARLISAVAAVTTLVVVFGAYAGAM